MPREAASSKCTVKGTVVGKSSAVVHHLFRSDTSLALPTPTNPGVREGWDWGTREVSWRGECEMVAVKTEAR